MFNFVSLVFSVEIHSLQKSTFKIFFRFSFSTEKKTIKFNLIQSNYNRASPISFLIFIFFFRTYSNLLIRFRSCRNFRVSRSVIRRFCRCDLCLFFLVQVVCCYNMSFVEARMRICDVSLLLILFFSCSVFVCARDCVK